MEIIRLKLANYQSRKMSDERSAAVQPLERARVTLMDGPSVRSFATSKTQGRTYFDVGEPTQILEF